MIATRSRGALLREGKRIIRILPGIGSDILSSIIYFGVLTPKVSPEKRTFGRSSRIFSVHT